MLGYEGRLAHWSSRRTLTRWWNSGMAARLASDRRCVSAAMRRPSAISLRTSANASPSPASLRRHSIQQCQSQGCRSNVILAEVGKSTGSRTRQGEKQE